MTIRESGAACVIGWAMAVWAGGFATNTVIAAGHLTSPQWVSLMTVPGGKYFWTAAFGGAALALAFGLLRTNYKARGAGFGLAGLGCLGIAVFYLVAPLFHAGPITLGYWPWFVPAGVGVVGVITNWWPIEWF